MAVVRTINEDNNAKKEPSGMKMRSIFHFSLASYFETSLYCEFHVNLHIYASLILL
jgi:hypothetical protein